MARYTVTHSRLHKGEWTCTLRADRETAPPPDLRVTHQEQEVTGCRLEQTAPGAWRLTVPVPPAVLSDGVQTVLLREAEGAGLLEHLTVIAGDALSHDLRAEIGLMRDELDLLKRAFRRHCLDTGAD